MRYGLAALGGLSALLLGGCRYEEGPYLQSEFYTTKAGESEVYNGGSCMSVSEGNGMGAGTAPGASSSSGEPVSYQYSYQSQGSGVRFEFVDEHGGVLEERLYDGAFIASGQRDEIVVDVAGDEMRFVNWGVQECEEIRDPDPEP